MQEITPNNRQKNPLAYKNLEVDKINLQVINVDV